MLEYCKNYNSFVNSLGEKLDYYSEIAFKVGREVNKQTIVNKKMYNSLE